MLLMVNEEGAVLFHTYRILYDEGCVFCLSIPFLDIVNLNED